MHCTGTIVHDHGGDTEPWIQVQGRLVPVGSPCMELGQGQWPGMGWATVPWLGIVLYVQYHLPWN